MSRILIADDHVIVRQGLTRILEEDGVNQVVAQCKNGIEALNWLSIHPCDLAIIDIAMPGMNGIDLLKQLQNIKPKLPVLILSIYEEDQYAVRLIRAGAAGYLNKDASSADFTEAVLQVLGGKKYITPRVAELLASEVNDPHETDPHKKLSDREYQILMLLASAQTATQIAATLSLSVKTVSTYRSRILEKMHLANNAELMQYVLVRNLKK
jgi:two-component system, NarL family, invasion response regulator UvrY